MNSKMIAKLKNVPFPDKSLTKLETIYRVQCNICKGYEFSNYTNDEGEEVFMSNRDFKKYLSDIGWHSSVAGLGWVCGLHTVIRF